MADIYRVRTDPTAPRLFLSDAPENRGMLPFEGGTRSERSPKASFVVHQQSPVTDPLQFWTLAPGIIVYPESMIGEDIYDSPYYCWAYHAELISFQGESDDFRGINASGIYPHPSTGFLFSPNASYPIFRLESEPATDLFTLAGHSVPGDELLATYNRYSLKGLIFEHFLSL